jgi:hypothetical protein
MRSSLPLLCWIFLALLLSGTARADDPMSYPTIATTDLTVPFHTQSAWSLVVTQEPDARDEIGKIHICFRHAGKAICPDILVHGRCDHLDGKPNCPLGAKPNEDRFEYNEWQGVAVFRPDERSQDPLLVATVMGNYSGPLGATGPVGPIIWAYRPDTDSFEEIFSGSRSSSVAEEVRLVASGPLAGDIVVNDRMDRRPYPYRIRVYQLLATRHYAKLLEYKSKAKYRDGNSLRVIDEEMPEIERRLGLWKPGDPLPVPPERPNGCTSLVLRKGVEWCK